MPKSVFIDTNTYLSFFRLSDNDLDEITKLQNAINSKRLVVFVTEQSLSEYDRNRENVISDAIKAFRNEKVPNSYPRLVQGYPEYTEIKEVESRFLDLRRNLLERAEEDARNGVLRADKLINSVLDSATLIPCTKEILAHAKDRMDRGNPPGKNGSYGDAINWEALLETVPIQDELVIISDDQDFATRLNPTGLSTFLQQEWIDRGHKGKISRYKTPAEFFKVHYPDIRLQVEFEQDEYISSLRKAPNYASTHLAISQLDPDASYTTKQAEKIIEAGVENSQVYAIGEDDDVKDFYARFLDRFVQMLSADEKKHFEHCFGWKSSK